MSADVVLLPVSWLRLANQGEGDWQEQALCAQADPEAWFPEKGGSTKPAKRICRACPVRTECAAAAMANAERYGVWGALSERDRRKLRDPGPVKHHHRWLTDTDLTRIQALLATGYRDVDIALRTGRSESAVARVRAGRAPIQRQHQGAA